MSYRKAKTAPKIYLSDNNKIRDVVLETMGDISRLVGGTLGPGGKVMLLESDHVGLPDRISKDGISVFMAMAHQNPYKHSIIEVARSCSLRTANECGDGTTTTAVLANELIRNIFDFCENNPKESPQKTVRRIKKVMEETLLPYIAERSIKVTEESKNLLLNVATISANGEKALAEAVLQCFEEVGYGEASHVTIRELPGPSGYKVERIEGYPIPIGLEESSGKYFPSYINDQGNQRCYLENPKFILYDGALMDLISLTPLFNAIEDRITQAPESQKAEVAKELKNIILVANGFSETVISTLSFNFEQTGTLRIVPIKAPMAQFMNAQSHWMTDLAAFTGAKVFGLKNQINSATIEDLGTGMENFEATRFRSTLGGSPDAVNIEYRADELRKQLKRAESKAESSWLEERIAKITSGIAKLTIIGSSPADIKERADRAEDAVCSIRSSITHGVLPGGGRVVLDMTLKISEELEKGDPAREVLMPSLVALFNRLLDNAGYHEEEASEVLTRLIESPGEVYDIENQLFGKAEDLGIFDATKAVSEALRNSVEIAGVLGTLGGIVCHPRDAAYERSEAKLDEEWAKVSENSDAYQNPALNRK
jgi:chaperonin GroEL